MKNVKKFSFLFFFIFICAYKCYSQDVEIDSLNNLIAKDINDTNKVKHLLKLCGAYIFLYDWNNAIIYGKQSLELSQRLNYKKGLAYSLSKIGNIYSFKNNNSESLKYYFKSLVLSKEIEFKKLTAGNYNDIAVSYDFLGNYNEALRFHFLALKIRQEINDKKGLFASYDNIGIIYEYQGKHNEALQNYFLALGFCEKIRDKTLLSKVYEHIGSIYRKNGKRLEALNYNLKSLKIAQQTNSKTMIAIGFENLAEFYSYEGKNKLSIKNHLIALNLYKEIEDEDGIATVLTNLGNLFVKEKKYPEALKNYLAALKLNVGEKAGLATLYISLGQVSIKTKQLDKARFYLTKANVIGKEVGYLEAIVQYYYDISQLDSIEGNFSSALKNYKYFISYRDSLINVESSKKIVTTQMQYEFEKKESFEKMKQSKKDLIEKEEKQKQKIITVAVGGVLVLVMIIAIVVFQSLRKTRKQKQIIELQKHEVEQQKKKVDEAYEELNQQNEEIASQRDEIEHQKHLVEEHQKEMIDSITYAKRIQDAILPPIDLIKEKLPNTFVLYKPKDIVAGDFYWMEEINNTILIAAADCTGHGVPGAMVSVVCSNALNRAVKEFHLSETGLILDKVTDLVLETFEKSIAEVKDGMDISLLSINKITKEIKWSGANNPLWYFENAELKEITANKQPIGKSDYRKPFTTHSIEYKSNTTFYLFTDGYADQFGGPKGKKFKYKPFQELLTANLAQQQTNQQQILNEAFENWKGELEQVDDVCVIGIRI